MKKYTEVDIMNVINNAKDDEEIVFDGSAYESTLVNPETYRKLGFSIKDATSLAKVCEYNQAKEMVLSTPTEHTLDDILHTLDIMKEDGYPYVSALQNLETKTVTIYKSKWQLEQVKYNKMEWEIIEQLFSLYYDSAEYDKETHTYSEPKFDQAHMTPQEIKQHPQHGQMPQLRHACFNAAYDIIERIMKHPYHISEVLATLANNALKAYKVNEHKNAGRPTSNRIILCIDKDTNKVIERYTSVKDIIELNPDEHYSKNGISQCLKGERKTYKGYIWKYAD